MNSDPAVNIPGRTYITLMNRANKAMSHVEFKELPYVESELFILFVCKESGGLVNVFLYYFCGIPRCD